MGQSTRPLLKSDIIKIDMPPASARSINEADLRGPADKLGNVPPDPFHRFGAFSGCPLDHLTESFFQFAFPYSALTFSRSIDRSWALGKAETKMHIFRFLVAGNS